ADVEWQTGGQLAALVGGEDLFFGQCVAIYCQEPASLLVFRQLVLLFLVLFLFLALGWDSHVSPPAVPCRHRAKAPASGQAHECLAIALMDLMNGGRRGCRRTHKCGGDRITALRQIMARPQRHRRGVSPSVWHQTLRLSAVGYAAVI